MEITKEGGREGRKRGRKEERIKAGRGRERWK